MRPPRFRFSIRWLMVLVALNGIAVAWAIDRAKRGHPLVILEYNRFVENEPLLHPTKVRAIEGECCVLEDGRVIRFEDKKGLIDFRRIGPEDLFQGKVLLDIEAGQGGSIIVHTLIPTWFCNSGPRPAMLPIRIPILPRIVYRNYRKFVGIGEVIRSGATAGP